MEEWTKIRSFDRYSISNEGRVRNDDTGRIMVIRRNNLGVYYVGLQHEVGVQKNRSVAVLVADHFLSDDHPESFNTPIHLDGDRSNNRVENLMWRPFWFAKKYHDQIRRRYPVIQSPIVERETGEVMGSMWEACLKYGLIEADLHISIMNRTFVWPTYQFWEFQE